MGNPDYFPDGLDEYRQIVRTHLLDTLEDALRQNGLSWSIPPAKEGGYRVYRNAACRVSRDVEERLSIRVIDTWLAIQFDGLVERYARGGIEPDRLYFGVGSRPQGDRLSEEEFTRRFRELAEFDVCELGGSIAARLSTLDRPPWALGRIEVVLRGDAYTEVLVILEGERGLMPRMLGLGELDESDEDEE